MPAPFSSKTLVVRCKNRDRNIPSATEARYGCIVVDRPACKTRRSYIVSTEVFMGRPQWEVMRAMQERS